LPLKKLFGLCPRLGLHRVNRRFVGFLRSLVQLFLQTTNSAPFPLPRTRNNRGGFALPPYSQSGISKKWSPPSYLSPSGVWGIRRFLRCDLQLSRFGQNPTFLLPFSWGNFFLFPPIDSGTRPEPRSRHKSVFFPSPLANSSPYFGHGRLFTRCVF